MIVLTIPGRKAVILPPQTEEQICLVRQLGNSEFQVAIPNAENVFEIAVAALVDIPIGEVLGVYFSHNERDWELSEALHCDRPSLIAYPNWHSCGEKPSSICYIGIRRLASLEEVPEAVVSTGVTRVRELQGRAQLAGKIAGNLISYLDSFSDFPSKALSAPLDRWYQRFVTKLSRDPDFLERLV